MNQLIKFAVRQTNEVVVNTEWKVPKMGYIRKGAGGTAYGMTTDLNDVKLFSTNKEAQRTVSSVNQFFAKYPEVIVSGTPHFEVVLVTLTFPQI